MVHLTDNGYYCVAKPRGMILDIELNREIKQWCKQHFGKPTPMGEYNFNTGGTWFTSLKYFQFKNQEDAILFSLRWE